MSFNDHQLPGGSGNAAAGHQPDETKWQSWRRRKAMWRAIPQLRELDRQEALCREKHRGGALRIQKARKAAVQAVLAGRREREA